jgi:hypothetical protein
MRGIVHGATAGAAVAFVTSWFLPWMADTTAFPLLGHAFTMWYFFLFQSPGPGAGLEILLMVLLGIVAIASVYFSAHRTAAITALLGVPPGIHLMVRDHPGLESGPGPLVAAVALAVIAVAQAIAFRSDLGRSWWSTAAGALVAVLLAVATGFGGSAYASARDVDATTSTGTGSVIVSTHDGVLRGITAQDSATGTERWHYWARGWAVPSARLSGDGRTVFVLVERATEHDALAFDAFSGRLRWQRALFGGSWPGQSEPNPTYIYLQSGPGMLLPFGPDQVRYIDADGREGTIQLDPTCGLDAAGGVHAVYIVEQCRGRYQLLATSRDAKHLWTSPAFQVPAGGLSTVVDNGDTVVVNIGGDSDTFDAATGKPRH